MSLSTQTLDFIKSDDFKQLLTFYCQKLKDFCKFFKFSKTVQFTAISLFRQFYLASFANPKLILIACLFLATKIENCPVDLNEFLLKIPKQPTRQAVLDAELLIAKTIGFQFMIKSPYFPLHGFYLDIQNLSLYTKALQVMETVVLTDLILTINPTQLALACMYHVKSEDFNLMEYLQSKLGESEERIQKLEQLLISLCKEIDNVNVLGKEKAKELSLKFDEIFEK